MSHPVVRELERKDLEGTFFNCLRRFHLHPGEMTSEIAEPAFGAIQRDNRMKVFVVEVDGEIVATATAFWRPVFIHSCGKVGYLEEVATRQDKEGNGYGVAAASGAIEWLRHVGCYKVILNCEPDKVDYYKNKLGFRKKDQGMRLDLE